MSEPSSKQGRTHDAEGAREAILNAAEKNFAMHGFDGARVDAIAATADYNKSLIFHYFGDKLGLYAAVIRRADRQLNTIQIQVIDSLLGEDVAASVHMFKAVLKTLMGAYFDNLVEHPYIMRILLWEMAEGWQTYAKIVSQREREEIDQLRAILNRVQSAGLLRSSFDPVIQLVLSMFFCQSYLGSISLYQMLLPGTDFSSDEAQAKAREHIIEFVVHGMILDLP